MEIIGAKQPYIIEKIITVRYINNNAQLADTLEVFEISYFVLRKVCLVHFILSGFKPPYKIQNKDRTVVNNSTKTCYVFLTVLLL